MTTLARPLRGNRIALASGPVLALVLGLLAAPAASALDAPVYSLSADALAGFSLAAEGFEPAVADSAAVWTLKTNLLHRIEAPSWGLVLSQALDFSGQAAGSLAFSPSVTVYEAYGRLDLGDWGQLFIGKRRMGLGIGSTFAPGDLIDPRTGFWDQKDGFRGLALSASLGPDLALRAALSLDRNLDAYAAGLKVKAAAAGTPPGNATAPSSATAAYAAALDGAAGPADPALLTWAFSADLQLGALELALSGVHSPGRVERPSLGLSFDLAGLILQAEGAVELADAEDPAWFGTVGARWTWTAGPVSLTLSLDYDRNGRPGILKAENYLLPTLVWGVDEVLNLSVRALVETVAPSALLQTTLALYPVQGFDIEVTGLFCLGADSGEFVALAAPPSPAAGKLANAIGLAARVHF
jgi:hypothetical protein